MFTTLEYINHFPVAITALAKSSIISAGRGHYLFLKKTSLRPGYVATLQTDFLYLNDTCIELYYVFMGGFEGTSLKLKVKSEVG